MLPARTKNEPPELEALRRRQELIEDAREHLPTTRRRTLKRTRRRQILDDMDTKIDAAIQQAAQELNRAGQPSPFWEGDLRESVARRLARRD